MMIEESFLAEEEFELGGKRWRINPLNAIVGKLLFYKHVRPLFGVIGDMQITRTNDEGEEEMLPALQLALGVLGRMPQEHLTKLTQTLIEKCLLVQDTENIGQYIPVARNYEVHFSGLKVSDLTIMDARLFAVNFGDSVSDLIQTFLLPPPGAELPES